MKDKVHKQCPWCKTQDQYVTSNGEENYFVQCSCGASGPVGENEEEAIRAWDDREE